MDIVKIVIIGLIFAVIIIYLKSVNKEIALLAAIAAGIILLASVLASLKEVFEIYNQIADVGGVESDLVKLIIKITIICYIIEFAVGLIEDFGLKSLADKVSLAGRIIIILTAAPVITALIKTIGNLNL